MIPVFKSAANFGRGLQRGIASKPFTHNVIGVVGLIACALIGLLDELGIWFAGPKIIRFIPLPLATFSEACAAQFGGPAEQQQLVSFWLYLVLYALGLALFAAAYWARTQADVTRARAFEAGLLALQIAIGVTVNQQLLFLVAAELAFVLAPATALAWLGAQMALLVTVQVPYLLGLGNLRPKLDLTGGILETCITLAWMIVAFGVGYIAASEKRSRIQLAGAHAELLATQQLLSGAIRASERVRIARDLHDAIGHHLTALNLHLDLALRQTGERTIESIRTSRELAQRLLAEVRVVVSTERQDQAIDLQQALASLCSAIPRPRIALTIDGDVEITAPALAHAIFRCVQEAISNTVRHSGASMLHIALGKQGDGLQISIADNGQGRQRSDDGNGLQGIRERVAELGGRVATGNLPDGGFSLSIWLPQHGVMQ